MRIKFNSDDDLPLNKILKFHMLTIIVRCNCNGCHDLMQKAMNFNDVAIVSIKGNDYRIRFWCMSKDDAISIMNNASLNKKIGSLYFFNIYKK